MNFQQIDAERLRQGRSVLELSRTAGVAYSTYWFIRTGRTTARKSTLERYHAALNNAPRRTPQRAKHDHRLADLYRAFAVIVAREMGVDPEAVLASNPRARANSCAKWRQAAHVRALAVYCVSVELGVEGASVGRAVGLTRQAVSTIRRRVEDFRDDPAIDALVERVGRMVSGRSA